VGVRGLPTEFATGGRQSVTPETGAKLAKPDSRARQRPSAGAYRELTADRGERPESGRALPPLPAKSRRPCLKLRTPQADNPCCCSSEDSSASCRVGQPAMCASASAKASQPEVPLTGPRSKTTAVMTAPPMSQTG